jgi:hypothetical protein
MVVAVLVCKVLAVVGGCLFVWAACFLKENEEGEVQRTLELWRDKLVVWPSATRGRRAAALRFCASAASTIFDRLFGQRLLSLRAVLTSATLSMGSILLVLPYIDHHVHTVLLGTLCCISAVAPAVSSRLSWLPIVSLALAVAIWFLTAFHRVDDLILLATFVVAAAIGVLSDFAFIVINRKLLVWAASKASFKASIAVLIAYFALTLLLVVGPYRLVIAGTGGEAKPSDSSVGAGIGAAVVNAIMGEVAIGFAAANGFTAVAASIVFLIGALLAIDTVFWFFAERPVYAAARYGIIQKKKSLFLIGAALLSSVSPQAGSLLRAIPEHYVK